MNMREQLNKLSEFFNIGYSQHAPYSLKRFIFLQD